MSIAAIQLDEITLATCTITQKKIIEQVFQKFYFI